MISIIYCGALAYLSHIAPSILDFLASICPHELLSITLSIFSLILKIPGRLDIILIALGINEAFNAICLVCFIATIGKIIYSFYNNIRG